MNKGSLLINDCYRNISYTRHGSLTIFTDSMVTFWSLIQMENVSDYLGTF